MRKTYSGADPQRRVPLDIAVEAVIGEPLRVWVTAETGASAWAEAEQPLEEARKHPLTEEVLLEQLGRLGATVYELRNLTAKFGGRPMVPLSVLGAVRKQLIERLEASAAELPARTLAERPIVPELRAELQKAAEAEIATENNEPELWVLCRSLPQLGEVLEFAGNAAAEFPLAGVYVDFMDIREYREAVARGREANVPVYPATPRIQKPGEMGIFHALAKYEPAGVLVRNLSGLRYYVERKIPAVADFSLNAANELTAAFLRGWGAERVTASYDLNREQLLELVAATPPAWLEVVIHQHMPMFHMEHCVFCAVLSPGTNKTNCGRPCDTHLVELRDRIGMEHPLTADVGCRNTLYNAQPQSGAEVANELLGRGVRRFRVELLRDSGEPLRRTLGLYGDLLAGRVRGREVWQSLAASNRVGVTRGTLETKRDPLAIV